jgi:hypothetical protein
MSNNRLNFKDIKKVLDINQRAFNLLKWLEEAIEKGIILVPSARNFISDQQIAKEWIVEHSENLPLDTKPNMNVQKELEAFVNLFGSFGLTSFEIIKHPGERYIPHSIRSYGSKYRSNKYIQPIKLSKKDKAKANQEKIYVLNVLINELCSEKNQILEKLMMDDDLCRTISLYVYCELLIKRINGQHSGKTHLVLWREFAWTNEGSPIKGFKLSEEMYLNSRLRIVGRINYLSSLC